VKTDFDGNSNGPKNLFWQVAAVDLRWCHRQPRSVGAWWKLIKMRRGLDAWIAEQPDRPVRPEAIRRLVSAALGLTRPKRSAPPKEPHFEPSPEQIEAIDRYRAGIELSRIDAISLLVDVRLRRVRTRNMD
jgi:hypothetical protein